MVHGLFLPFLSLLALSLSLQVFVDYYFVLAVTYHETGGGDGGKDGLTLRRFHFPFCNSFSAFSPSRFFFLHRVPRKLVCLKQFGAKKKKNPCSPVVGTSERASAWGLLVKRLRREGTCVVGFL